MKAIALAAALLSSAVFAQASAVRETAPIPSGNIAGDTAVWLHPTDLSKSLIFGTDMGGGATNGLYVHALDGGQMQTIPDGPMRAVDVRYNIKLGAGRTDVVLGVGTNGAFRLYAPVPDAGSLVPLNTLFTASSATPLAGALFTDPLTQSLSVFISDTNSALRQYNVLDDGAGHLVPSLLRTIMVGTDVRGIVADDRNSRVFVTLQNTGLYSLPATTAGGTTLTLVEAVDAGRLEGATGVTLYPTADGGGVLIAAASLTSSFSVYALSTGTPFVTTFQIVPDAGREGVSNSEGIDITPLNLGAPFSQGMFVASDKNNFDGPNYKLVQWADIVAVTGTSLPVDTTVDPRLVNLDAGSGTGGGAGGGAGGGSGTGGTGQPTSSASRPPVFTGGPYAETPPAGGCHCGQEGLLFPLAGLLWAVRRRKPRTE